MDTKLKLYRQIAADLYPTFTAADGIGLEEIEKAEKIYGFSLPKTLREFYLLSGNHHGINASFNELLSVDCLEIEDNKLIFYQEHQAACSWAIDLSDIAKDDPPVWKGLSIFGQEKLDWHFEAAKLSDFLLIMLCWQSVMGALPFTGIADQIDKAIIQTVNINFSLLETGENHSGLQAFTNNGKVICLAENKEEISIYAGASGEEKFLEIMNLLQIEWDFCSLND